MSKQEFSLAYSGPDKKSDHTIDVDTLAPALLAMGKLIREANKEINGKTATAKVYVVSDFEHKCFNVNFEVVLSFIEQARTLMGTETAKDAKEILEWLDLLGSYALGGVSVLGLMRFLKWRNGRRIEEASEISDSDQTGLVRVRVEGDRNDVTVHNHTYNLATSPKALSAVRDIFSPIGTEGFETLEVAGADGDTSEIPKDDADQIIASCLVGIDEANDTTPDVETTSAWLTVFSPVYDANAEKWRFKLGKEVIYADITETKIVEDALARGGSMVDDAYQVKLEIETPKTPEGKSKKPNYKILEVMRFFPARPEIQTNLPLGDD